MSERALQSPEERYLHDSTFHSITDTIRMGLNLLDQRSMREAIELAFRLHEKDRLRRIAEAEERIRSELAHPDVRRGHGGARRVAGNPVPPSSGSTIAQSPTVGPGGCAGGVVKK